jgi:opacity protein-like surface antigen
VGENMKKTSIILLCSIIVTPALATNYDDYDQYDNNEHISYNEQDNETRDTYVGFRIHRNEHIVYKNELDNGFSTKIRDNNFGIGLNIGNRLTNNVKIEFETMYTGETETKHATSFDYDVWSNMLNVYMFKNYGGAVEPYAGLGIGFSGIWSDINGAVGNFNDHNFDLSFALMGGVNFALNKYIDLNLGLRYIDYGTVQHTNAKTNVDATEIYIGAAYKFGIFK